MHTIPNLIKVAKALSIVKANKRNRYLNKRAADVRFEFDKDLPWNALSYGIGGGLTGAFGNALFGSNYDSNGKRIGVVKKLLRGLGAGGVGGALLGTSLSLGNTINPRVDYVKLLPHGLSSAIAGGLVGGLSNTALGTTIAPNGDKKKALRRFLEGAGAGAIIGGTAGAIGLD